MHDGSNFPTFSKHLFSVSPFKNSSHLNGYEIYLIVVLTHAFLETNYVEPVFMWLLVTNALVYLFGNHLIQTLKLFLLLWVFLLWQLSHLLDINPILLIYLFMAMLGLCCCSGFSLVAVSGGLFSSCSVQASLCGGFSCCKAQALGYMGFRSCGTWAQQLWLRGSGAHAQQLWCTGLLLWGMWDLPGSGIEPMSFALASRFCTTDSIPPIVY